MSVIHFNRIVAFVPSAGLGTRLKPLTNHAPKALVQFMGRSMLEGVLYRLHEGGLRKFIINVHHFPEQMFAAINELSKLYNIRISDETAQLLDTGGGLARAGQLLTEDEQTILVHNVDVYAGFDLQELIRFHAMRKNDVTFAVSERTTSRKLVFNGERLCGWVNEKTQESIGNSDASRFAFSGIHLVEKAVIAATENNIFPLIPHYLSAMNRYKIEMFKHNANRWFDLGTPERIVHAESVLKTV